MERVPPHADNGSIFWPWVGEGYRRGGVCVLSLNVNHANPVEWHGLAAEYSIAGKVFNAWQRGRKAVFGRSAFHWRMMATALAAIHSNQGAPLLDSPSLAQTTDAFEEIARVQSVKCSPRGQRSHPPQTMKQRCPGRFALPELSYLRPSVVVLLGADAAAALRSLAPIVWATREGHFGRGTIDLPYGRVQVLRTAHPAARGAAWPDSYGALLRSLRSETLNPGPGRSHLR